MGYPMSINKQSHKTYIINLFHLKFLYNRYNPCSHLRAELMRTSPSLRIYLYGLSANPAHEPPLRSASSRSSAILRLQALETESRLRFTPTRPSQVSNKCNKKAPRE